MVIFPLLYGAFRFYRLTTAIHYQEKFYLSQRTRVNCPADIQYNIVETQLLIANTYVITYK